MADALFLGFPVDNRSSGRELVAKAEVVHEAGDLLVALATLRLAADHLRKRWKFRYVDVALFRCLPVADGGVVGEIDADLGDRRDVARVNDDPVHFPNGIHLDFRLADRADMHARLEPMLEENG